MFRTLLLIVALVIVIGIVLVATGVIHLSRDANGNVTVTANPVTVGTENRTVQVPVVRTEERQIQVPAVTVGNAQATNAQ
jgi:preprotein translocase subunit SecF